MTRLACLALVLCPPGLCAEDKKPDAKADVAALKGKWKVTAHKFDGKDTKLDPARPRTLVFDEKEFAQFDGPVKGRALTYTLDPAHDPKHIDLVLVGGKEEQKVKGLYQLKGDTLTLCYGEPGKDRPAKIESKPGGRLFLVEVTRVK